MKNKLRRRPDAYAAGCAFLAAYATLDNYTAADSVLVARWLELLQAAGYDWNETHQLVKKYRKRLKVRDPVGNEIAVKPQMAVPE